MALRDNTHENFFWYTPGFHKPGDTHVSRLVSACSYTVGNVQCSRLARRSM